jgi:predicted phage baseplate assembly protein
MTWGRDVREPELTMLPAPVPGGLEPRLLADTREEIRAGVAGRASAYTPEWTDRSTQDAGVALVRAHGTLGAAVARRLNRLPRKLAITAVDVAGVRARSGTPASGLAGLVVADSTTALLAVPAGSVFLTPAGSEGPALETGLECHALPGTVASVATLNDGWTVLDDATDLGSLAPFGRRRRPPAELWWGVGSPVLPAGRLGFAVLLTAATGRATAVASPAVSPGAMPALRWEALTAAGAEELVVERDGTSGLTRAGVVLLRADTRAPWLQTTLPGRDGDPPLLWLRARLVSDGFPASVALRSVVLNGVTVLARRTVRDEVAEPIERKPSGRSRYRLSQVPVLPGTVTLDILETAGDPFGTAAEPAGAPWREVPTLTTADPDDRVFTLESGTGILTFGDGRHGRAVAAGYRNVVARTYATGGGTAGLPLPGDILAPERSVPGLTGATVLALTTGSDAETSAQLLRRGPATIRSRQRAVAASDYARSALDTSGIAVARAHCLPATDVRSSGAVVPGTVTVVVVPRIRPGTAPATPPMPDAEVLAAVAEGLARSSGVLGASVVAVAPVYRDIAVTALLVGSPTADLAMLESAARDALGDWFSPLTGGPERAGWPFGGMVRWDATVRMLLGRVADLQAVSRLSFRVGNRRLPVCSDVALASDELVWPGGHVLETRRGEAS